MHIWENLKTISFQIATIKGLGKSKFGSLIASCLAFPFILGLYFVGHLSPILLHWALLLGLVFFLVVIHFALRVANIEDPKKAIVLDQIMGLMIAFWRVAFRWRVMVFGFIVFHIFNNVKTPSYNKVISKLERLPGVLGVVLPDLLTGVLVNIFLQLMLWALS